MKFADTITNQLVSVVEPRFGMIRNHQFEVQDKAWTDPYHKRSNLPPLPYHDFPNMQLRKKRSKCTPWPKRHTGRNRRAGALLRSNGGSCSNCCILLRGKACRPSEQQLGKKSHGLHEGFPGGEIGIRPHSVVKSSANVLWRRRMEICMEPI